MSGRTATALALIGVLAAGCTPPTKADAPTADAESATQAAGWSVPAVDTLPDNDWGRAVRYGRDLMTKTSTLIGPEVADPHMRYSGNNLACASCHLEAGGKKLGLPYVGVYADFPNYRARSGSIGTIEDRVNGCMTRSMNGKALPLEGREMIAMVSYLKFMSTGIRVGDKTPGRGAGEMPELTRAADPARGEAVFQKTCVTCHGADGAGRRVGVAGDAKGYAVPPLWGPDSFNDGAGMARLITAANFIHNNMPDGTTAARPALSVADAWDVAAYVVSQPRPHREHLDADYPKRSEKPVDAPYGPYADGRSVTAHKFGPFAALRQAASARP